MRAFAITGIVTASMISWTLVGSAMRATPPSARMSAGTRSSAMTATAPASSAIFAWSAVVTSMMTPPFNISASPDLTRNVPVSRSTVDPSSRLIAASLPPGPACLPARSGRDRDPGRNELHPGVAGLERDLVAGPVLEGGEIGDLRAFPRPLDAVAVPADVGLAAPGRNDLRRDDAVHVAHRPLLGLHDLDDHVLRRDLVAVLQGVRHRSVGAEPLAALPPPIDVGVAGERDVERLRALRAVRKRVVVGEDRLRRPLLRSGRRAQRFGAR